MTALKSFTMVALLLSMAICTAHADANSDEKPVEEPSEDVTESTQREGAASTEGSSKPAVDAQYAKSSLCGYCKYCKFCSLCDTDCPCHDGKRVGCDMCKYCSYCKLCSVCDTFCQPGGFLDTVASSLLSVVGSVDTEKVDEHIARDPRIKEYL